MNAQILDGKVVRDAIALKLQEKVKALKIKPCIAIVQVGDNKESTIFIKQKKLFGEKIGVDVQHLIFSLEITESELLIEIDKLNKQNSIQGIIVQFPLPVHLSKETLIEAIDYEKDIDGLHSINVKKLLADDSSGIVSATARGVLSLCRYYNIDPKRKHVVVVGRSMLVGEPVAITFLNAGATVTICHKQTIDLASHTKQADILIVATGVAKLITKEHVREGQVIIDIGITSIENIQEGVITKKIIGDVDFEEVNQIIKAITPVPGGVGPLTVASLFENTVDCAEKMLK